MLSIMYHNHTLSDKLLNDFHLLEIFGYQLRDLVMCKLNFDRKKN